MSIRVIKDTVKKAAKDHICDSCLYIREHLSYNKTGNPFKFSEWRLIAAAKRDNWKILNGQFYHHQVNVLDGDIYTFKSRLGLVSLCIKYELYPEI